MSKTPIASIGGIGQRLVPALLVRDMGETLAFYRKLGFRLTGCHPGEDNPDWIELMRESVVIQFHREPPRGTPTAPVCSGTFYIYPESVTAVAEALRGKIECAWGPEVMPYGMYELGVRDPNGYYIAFTERSDPPVQPEPPDDRAVIVLFIEAINAHDVALLADLMSENHTFVDASGTQRSGRDTVTSGWRAYHNMFPDYRLHVDSIIQDGPVFAIFGTTSATYRGHVLGGPTAWKAVVEQGRVKVWQVYADYTETWRVLKAPKTT